MSDASSTSSRSLAFHASIARSSPVWTIFVVTGMVGLAVRLLNLPLNRIIEARYCKAYYLRHEPSLIDPSGQVPEELCKIGPVQGKLVWLESALSISQTICDIVAAIPFGAISDRIGRKLVLLLNISAKMALFAWVLFVGKFDRIPVEAMMAAPVSSLLGGGDCVYDSVTYAYLSDFAKDTHRRTRYFAYITSISYVFSLLGPVLAAATMSIDIWLPFYLGLGLLSCAIPITALLVARSPRHGGADAAVDGAHNIPETTPLLEEDNTDPSPQTNSHSTFMQWLFSEIKGTFRFVTNKPTIQQILAVVLLLGVAKSCMDILVLYLSKRYHKTFAQVGYLLSIKAGVNVLLFTVIVPLFLKFWLKKFPGMQITADFLGAQASLLLASIATLCLALASQLWMAILAIIIYALGTATSVFILSLVKSPVVSFEDEDDAGRDISMVIMVQTIGSLIGAPIFAALWVRGINKGGVALGLPYFVASAFHLVIFIVVLNLHRHWEKPVRTSCRNANGPDTDTDLPSPDSD